MEETYVWNRKSVNRNVAKNLIGCYPTRKPRSERQTVVGYIGRSLRCLNNRLSNNHPKRKLYTMLDSVNWNLYEVFDTECRWFHLYSGEASTNLKHPDSPACLAINASTACDTKQDLQITKQKMEVRSDAKKVDFVDDIDFLRGAFDFGVTIDDGIKELVDNSLDANAERIFIELNTNKEGGLLKVTDDGDGIPTEFKE